MKKEGEKTRTHRTRESQSLEDKRPGGVEQGERNEEEAEEDEEMNRAMLFHERVPLWAHKCLPSMGS